MQKASSGFREGRGCPTIIHPVNFPEALALESILAKRCVCTQGRALSQAKYGLRARQSKMIWPKETRKTCPRISDLKHPQSAMLCSISLSVSLSLHLSLSLPSFSVSLSVMGQRRLLPLPKARPCPSPGSDRVCVVTLVSTPRSWGELLAGTVRL